MSAVRSGTSIIQNASDLFNFCASKMTVAAADTGCSHFQRSFVQVKKKEIKRSMKSADFTALKGTMNLHSLVPSSCLGYVKTKDLSCFCRVCLVGEAGTCDNLNFIYGWVDHKIKLNGKPVLQQQET